MSRNDSYQYLLDFIDSDVNTWQERITKLAVKYRKHPDYPLFKLKYSMFEADFTNPVTRCCRGSVVEVTDRARLVQAPYFKFCNKQEPGEDEIMFPAYAIDKVDGSLAIFCNDFKYGKLWTTSGSFETKTECPDNYDSITEPETLHLKSFQDIIDYSLDKYGSDWTDKVPSGWTIMLEIISPRNRIIVKNLKTELVLHGARNPYNEVRPEIVKEAFDIPFRIPEKTRVNGWDDVGAILEKYYTDGTQKEGLIIVDAFWDRIKIKSEAYVLLKHVKGEGNYNDKSIFSAILSGDIDDAVAAWPELTERVDVLKAKFVEVLESIKDVTSWGKKLYATLIEQSEDAKAAKKLYAAEVMKIPEYQRSWAFSAIKYGDFVPEIDWNTFVDLRDKLFGDTP
jgi:hypothetical protein